MPSKSNTHYAKGICVEKTLYLASLQGLQLSLVELLCHMCIKPFNLLTKFDQQSGTKELACLDQVQDLIEKDKGFFG